MKKPVDIDALVAEACPPRPNPQLAFTMPVRVDSETNGREHWTVRSRRKRKQKEAVVAAWPTTVDERYGIVVRRKVSPPCVVRLIRISSRRLDDDNLREAFKAIRDEIADELNIDDGDERIKWEYAQVPVGHRVYQVRVEVY